MPPKRAAPETSAGRAKRSRSAGDAATATATARKTTTETTSKTKNATASKITTKNMTNKGTASRSKRWAPISGSANVDVDYKIQTRNPLTAYRFLCLCRAPFRDEVDRKSLHRKAVKCDDGKTCLCNKPASEHPNHVWKVSFAGKLKYLTLSAHFALRCPDVFGMYTFNDHGTYGVVEILQNLILDFEEAAGNYKEKWAICEALAFWLQGDGLFVTQISDHYVADATLALVGRLFMSMLALLDANKLLSKDSEIQNLGLIMGLFMCFASACRDYNILKDEEKEFLGPPKDRKRWVPDYFDDQILAYSRRHRIALAGPNKLPKIIANAAANVDVELPVPPGPVAPARWGPFGFAKALRKYKEEFYGITAYFGSFSGGRAKETRSPIGGDHLDITTWTSAERASKTFDGKDPIGRKEMNALKEGRVVMPE
ncbi:hypothetical protein C7999DRAFT_42421 [Corynascus novoguineensis]|uniref:Uncharacterized protein n=1 Tax=Corynascus novoguineensis TaxID=1126955 RepID=A0AAN7HDP4_9PEZI|nr:hypothetical protein C7999DRAFT_42421 [Corynascus novoguineensis]